MVHKMRLREKPFSSIKYGVKTIELRLFDEKRQKIHVGDFIKFTCLDYAEPSLLTKVTALHCFGSFAELYRDLPLERCGYTPEEVATGRALPSDMEQYYSIEEQDKHGVVGIEIELLPESENNLRIWVDDVRPAPSGYVWCRSTKETIQLIEVTLSLSHSIELIDIDHDAGDFAEDGGDFIRILDWLEEHKLCPPIRIHSMNPVGVQNMRSIIRKNKWEEVR